MHACAIRCRRTTAPCGWDRGIPYHGEWWAIAHPWLIMILPCWAARFNGKW